MKTWLCKLFGHRYIPKKASENGLGVLLVDEFCEHCNSKQTSVIRAEIHGPSQSVTTITYLKNQPLSLQTQMDIFKNYYFEKRHPDGSPLVEPKQLTTPIKAEF